MYIHVILFIFLIFLFVLSLEQALTDIQHTIHTDQEQHPGALRICTVGESEEIEKGQQNYDTNLQNLSNSTNHQQQFYVNDSEPSCSFSHNIYNNVTSNNPINLYNEHNMMHEDPGENDNEKCDHRLQLVPMNVYVPELQKFNYDRLASYKNGANDVYECVNDYNINSPATYFQFTKKKNNEHDSDQINGNYGEQFDFKFSGSTIQTDIDRRNREKDSVHRNDDMLQRNKGVDYKWPSINQSLCLMDDNRNQNNLPYYVSDNEFDKFKFNQQDQCSNNNNKKYKEFNCNKMHFYPVLVSDNLLRNLLLIKGSNLAFNNKFNPTNYNLGSSKPKPKIVANTDKVLYPEMRKLDLVNKKIMSNETNKCKICGSIMKESELSRLMQLLTRNQPSKCGNCGSTHNSDITPTNKRYVTIKYTTPNTGDENQNNIKNNDYDKMNDQLSKLVQNFFKVLADSVSKKNETIGTNTCNNKLTTINDVQTLKYDSFLSGIVNDDNNNDDKKHLQNNEIDNLVLKITDELNKTDLDSNQEFYGKNHTMLLEKENNINLVGNEMTNQPIMFVNKDSDKNIVQQNTNIDNRNDGTSNLSRYLSRINVFEDNSENTDVSNTGCDNINQVNSGAIKKIIERFNGKQLNKFSNSILNKDVKRNSGIEVRDLSLPVLVVAQPDFQPEDATKSYETSNDYLNPLIYWQRRMFPEIPLKLPVDYKSSDQRKCDTNRGVISGKVYVTGPKKTLPDMIHIINPDLIRTIHERAGPRNVHFCLDNSNEDVRSLKVNLKEVVDMNNEAIDLPHKMENNMQHNKSITLVNPSREIVVEPPKETLLQQLKRINDTLNKIRDDIHKQLKFNNHSTDIVENK